MAIFFLPQNKQTLPTFNVKSLEPDTVNLYLYKRIPEISKKMQLKCIWNFPTNHKRWDCKWEEESWLFVALGWFIILKIPKNRSVAMLQLPHVANKMHELSNLPSLLLARVARWWWWWLVEQLSPPADWLRSMVSRWSKTKEQTFTWTFFKYFFLTWLNKIHKTQARK